VSEPGGVRPAEGFPGPDDRPLLPFLPMVYVAWADGELTSDEIAAISARVEAVPGLDARSRERLARWLDPDSPPAARELAAILRLIQRTAPELPPGRRVGLAELGMELAREAGGDGGGAAAGEVRRALDELEAVLGVDGAAASREVLAAERPRPRAAVDEPAPPFDVAALRRLLDGEHREVRDEVRSILSEPAFAPRYGIPTAEYRELVLGWARELARRGFGSLSYPPEAGGRGDLGAFVAAFETLAFGDLSLVVGFGVQFGLFGGSVLQLGTERHHRRWLPAIGSLELPGGFAMSETGHGSNVRDLETVARYDRAAGEFVIATPNELARKDWIGNAAVHGRMVTVFAQLVLDDAGPDGGGTAGDPEGDPLGVHAFLVPIRDEAGAPLPGVSIEDCGEKEGLNGVDNGRIRFDGVRVPRENLLDRFASVSPDGEYSSPIPGAAKRFFTMVGTLVGGRISVAAAAVSAAKVGLAIAVRYAVHRRQFGPPGEPERQLLDYQSHRRRLLPRLAAAYAYHFAARRVARRFVERTGDDAREVETQAAALKALATWQTVDTLQECREACGGQGYLSENRFGRLKNDTDVFTTFEGDNTVLLQLVARARLGEYGKRFGEMQVFHLVEDVLGRAATRLTEMNPVVVRRTDREHLRDPDFHLGALRYREERLLATVARRIKRRLDDGMDSFDAFEDCQDHLLSLARAYGERVVLEGFQAAVEAARGEGGETDGEEADGEADGATVDGGAGAGLDAPLAALCALWSLWRIDADAGWFLENGYLEGGKAGAIRAEVLALCAELRPLAVPLVDAFGVPNPLLPPIAFGAGT